MKARKALQRATVSLAAFILLAMSGGATLGEENTAQKQVRSGEPSFNLDEQHVLYCVGYAHLDTQWRWDYPITVDSFIRDTLEQNFSLMEKYPEYTFSFTGSVRYEMMAEYYPNMYERMKQYIDDGRWFVSGSSVDEGDVNVPSAEAIIRQILYGNRYFKREFGKESLDFMLPDCFGFPASMPSIWAHCGLLGFSTQKLTWGSAVGIPFNVGVWEGPDGESVIAALNPGSYASALEGRVDLNQDWAERIARNGERYGFFADYHYYGVGDQGGAPKEKDVKNYVASIDNDDSKFHVELAASDQMYRDITAEQRARLPRYKGDMLLTEHSAGTLTSQSYMKRWNRMGEQLADAAERAAVTAWWMGGIAYPRDVIERSWVRLLANQMHDILPGTSIPVAYTWSWNDEIVAMNGFARVLTDATGAVSRTLDTRGEGASLVVYNPLAIEREDCVAAKVSLPNAKNVRVFGPDGKETPSQVLSSGAGQWEVLFIASVPPVGYAVYDVRPADQAFSSNNGPSASTPSIENEYYRVTLNDAGDIASIMDKKAGRELLASPAQLVFTHESPRSYPAWNMDWEDRKNPPIGVVEGPAKVRVVESGPVRAALEITRETRGSIFRQTIRLTRGDAGRVVEVVSDIDWQSTGVALKASFPLTVSNPLATYNWGMGTIERGNNEPVKYEVPSHEWFDLTDAKDEYGVSLVEDSKFGSDKPTDNELRLTLLYSPEVRSSFMDQHSQDWGRHDIVYGLYAHNGDWRAARSEWRGRRLNQPLKVFAAEQSPGPLGKTFSTLAVNTPQVDVRAVKLAEDRDEIIVRLQELWGRDAKNVQVRFAAPIASATEVDGQERPIGDANLVDGMLSLDMTPYSPRSFALKLAAPPANLNLPQSRTVALRYDTDAVSNNENRADGAMDDTGGTLPAEQLPERLTVDGVTFELAPQVDGALNALACQGQAIELPAFGDRVHVLAAAGSADDVEARFVVGDIGHSVTVQPWTGFIGQWNTRVFDRPFQPIDFRTPGHVVDILPSFIRRDPIAWFATHRHEPEQGDVPYQFSYLYTYDFPRPEGATVLQLPVSPRVKVFAVSVSDGAQQWRVHPAAPLYDDFNDREPVKLRHKYPPPPLPIFTKVKAAAEVSIDRADAFDKLSMGAPTDDDFADAHSPTTVRFLPGKDSSFHPQGANALERLNDGAVARNHDDTGRCVWSDDPARFHCDLGAARNIERINTYSWHRSDRAPQYCSVWGAADGDMPSPEFKSAKDCGWTLLGVLDTRRLGQGGIHGTSIHAADATTDLGQYRYLLWVIEDSFQGTFFTEVDVHVAE